MKYRLTIDRWSGGDDISKENWKDPISALVLCGFEVCGDDGKIVFETGDGEVVEEINKN